MKRIVTCALAMTLLLGLYAPAAEAHVKVINTRIRFNVSDTRVDRGQVVIFRGALKSPNRRCIRNKTIKITRNRTHFARTVTNTRGKYRIAKKVRRPGKYRAVFEGFQFGVHPHSHTCAAVSSGPIRIRIQR